jgi:hypothetical protein
MSSNLITEQQHALQPTRLIPIPEWNQHHSWPPIGGMRHLIFNAKTNGFACAFKRVGRRVLVDEREFFAVIDRNNGGSS